MSFSPVRVVALVALTLVLAGCGGTDRTAVGPPPTTTAVPASPVVAGTPSSAAPSTTECQQTKAWSQTKIINWVRAMAATDPPGNVVLGGDKAVLSVCTKVPVQVEFWLVGLTSFGSNVTFRLTSALRKQATVDGRRPATVKAPKDFTPVGCRGTLTAVYVGKPMAKAELPVTLDFGGSNSGTVEFNTDRVAYSELRMPGTGDDLRQCHI
jgi:hypothetical protein